MRVWVGLGGCGRGCGPGGLPGFVLVHGVLLALLPRLLQPAVLLQVAVHELARGRVLQLALVQPSHLEERHEVVVDVE